MPTALFVSASFSLCLSFTFLRLAIISSVGAMALLCASPATALMMEAMMDNRTLVRRKAAGGIFEVPSIIHYLIIKVYLVDRSVTICLLSNSIVHLIRRTLHKFLRF